MTQYDDIILALSILEKANDVIKDTHGNISVLSNDRKIMYIKPSGMAYSEITSDDICLINLSDGMDLGVSKKKPSVDTQQHRAIYLNNNQINSICHTHSPYATAFAMAGRPLECLCTEHADYFGHHIRCMRYQSYDNWGNIFLGKDESAILLENHGTLTFADNAKNSAKLAIALENVAFKNFLVKQFEDNPNKLTRAEIKKWHDRYKNVYGQ